MENIENNNESVNVNVKNEPSKSNFGIGFMVGALLGILGTIAVILIVILVKFLAGRNSLASADNIIDFNTLRKIRSTQRIIEKTLYEYDDSVDATHVEDGIFEGMIASLNDPYAEYFSTENIKEVMNGYEGVSYGIGCYVSMDENKLPVIAGIFEDSPAEEADVREGDIIIKVGDEPTVGLSLSAVVGLIKGPENTEVTVTFQRDGEEIVKTIKRGKLIETDTVQYGTVVDKDDIGYVRIIEFDEVTYSQFKEAMDDLKESGIKSLILDLRSNPGGDVDTVVDIAREILPQGLVVYTEDKNGKRRDYTCDGKNEIQIPMVVLVNEYSASASEILAGAIQDYNKGTILGTTTYGKGIVQRVFSLEDGSAIKITTSSYFTPKGRNIHGTGIKPDIELEFDAASYEKDGTDNQANKAIEILEQK